MELNSSISAVVTGGASGLGLATTKALIAHGVKVAMFDLNPERGEAAVKETDQTTASLPAQPQSTCIEIEIRRSTGQTSPPVKKCVP